MRTQFIAEVGIDYDSRIFVRPFGGDFEHVYRAAMEVYWDCATRQLSHPAPRDLSPLQWYKQIIAAVADEYGVLLQPTDDTIWTNIEPDLHAQIARD